MDGFRVDFVDCPVIQAFCVPPMKVLVVELERCTSSGVIDWNFAAGIFAMKLGTCVMVPVEVILLQRSEYATFGFLMDNYRRQPLVDGFCLW